MILVIYLLSLFIFSIFAIINLLLLISNQSLLFLYNCIVLWQLHKEPHLPGPYSAAHHQFIHPPVWTNKSLLSKILSSSSAVFNNSSFLSWPGSFMGRTFLEVLIQWKNFCLNKIISFSRRHVLLNMIYWHIAVLYSSVPWMLKYQI